MSGILAKRWPLWPMFAAWIALLVAILILINARQQNRWDESLRSANPAVRAAAIRHISNESRLIGALKDENPDVRFIAARRLGGKAAGAAALVGLFPDEHDYVRRQAAESLGWIGPPAWPTIRNAMGSEDPNIRRGALRALLEPLGPKEWNPWPAEQSDVIMPMLQKLSNDPDPEVSRLAVKVAGSIESRRRQTR